MGKELRSLISRQNELKEELSKVLDGASDTLTEEQEKRCKQLKDSIVSLGSQIEYRSLADEAERAQGAIESEKKEFRSFSISRLIQSVVDGGKTDAGDEKEVSAELEHRSVMNPREGCYFIPRGEFYEKRTVSPISTANTGAYLIENELKSDQYIDSIWEANPFSKLNVRRLSGLTGNVTIPKSSSVTSVGWFADGDSIAATDKSFATVTMSPRYIGAIATISLGMLTQSSIDVDKLIMADFSKAVALEEAKAILNGRGATTYNEPVGLLAAANSITAIPTNENKMLWASDCIAALFQNNIENVSFLVRSANFADCEGNLTTDKLPIDASTFFRGRKHVYFSAVPEGKVLVAGDFSEIIVASWTSPQILINPFSAYDKGQVQVRIIDAIDVAVRHTEAFCTLGGTVAEAGGGD